MNEHNAEPAMDEESAWLKFDRETSEPWKSPRWSFISGFRAAESQYDAGFAHGVRFADENLTGKDIAPVKPEAVPAMTDERIDFLAQPYRNAAGGIYATSVHAFARDVAAEILPDPYYKPMFHAAVRALAEIDGLLGVEPDGCNDPMTTVSALKDYIAGRVALSTQEAAPNTQEVQDDLAGALRLPPDAASQFGSGNTGR